MDQVSVLGVKHRLLERTGAELPAAQDGTSEADQRQQTKFPLRAASYASAAGDLANGTWAAELQKAGREMHSLCTLHTHARLKLSLQHVGSGAAECR